MPRKTRYVTEAETFAELLSEKWAHVEYDSKTDSGRARIGNMGTIQFESSGNDPAVIVTISAQRIKSRPEDVMKALDEISEILGNTSL